MPGIRLSSIASRLKNSFVALLFMSTQLVFPLAMSGVAHAANQAANLDQWGNSAPAGWQNGNLNSSNSSYHEGESVPFRAVLTNMSTGTHTLTIQYDSTVSGKHAYDYLTSYNRTVTAADPCVGVSPCAPGIGQSIPPDPSLAAGTPSVTQVSGQISIFNGTISSVAYNPLPTSSQGTANSVTVLITFTVTNASAVIAWGGHIASQSDWGANQSASAISGSSYHMRLQGLDTASIGNQDRSLKASAVILFPYLTITKIVDNSNGGTALPSDFTFTVSPAINGQSTYSVTNDVPADGSGSVTIFNVPNGSYTVTETGGPAGYVMTGGSNVLNCPFTGTTGTATVASGVAGVVQNASCSFTNSHQQATLILQKTVVNDNGGTLVAANFPVSIGGTSASWGSNTVAPGTYTVSETQQPGYQAGSWGGDCSSTGSVTLTNGQTKTCTITNNDIPPSLTLVKKVVNANGGQRTASEWTLTATGASNSPTNLSGAGGATSGSTFKADTYTLGETGPTDYSASSWSCTNNVTVNANNQISLALGQSTTCTITNTDIAPTLTLVKNVINDNGGTATADQWTLKAQHGTDIPLINMTGTPSNNGLTATTSTTAAKANTTYTLSESGPTGYAASNWNCTSGIVSGNTVTLALNTQVTCSITNNDIAPLLTVTKVVDNNNGGTLQVSNFPLYVNNLQVTSGVQTSFNAGTYTVSETQQPGYTLSGVNGSCSLSNGTITVQMVVGGVYTCTLTNTDIPATIKVTKVVHNNHGGTLTASDFNLYVGATKVVSGVANTFAANQAYTVSEGAVTGYHQDNLVCVDPSDQSHTNLGATFTPVNGQEIDCTITNSDVAPQLTVIKHVINNNGGKAVAGDFTMNVTGSNVSNSSFAGAESPGTTVTLNAGAYSVDEGSHTGYTETKSSGCSGTIAIGQTAICTITNDDIAPTLTIVKDVVNDDGGNAKASAFPVTVNGTTLTGGVLTNSDLTDTYTYNGAAANNAYLVGEADPTANGYTQTSLVCIDNNTHATISNPVTLSPGQNATCVITNNDIKPSLTVVKEVANNHGGNAMASDFTLKVNTTILTGGILSNNNLTDTYSYSAAQANTAYIVSEVAVAGYTQTSLVCIDNNTQSVVANPVTLNPGQNVTCVVTNSDKAPSLTVVKDVINDNGGNNTADSFVVTVNGTPLTGGTLSNNGLTNTYVYSNPLANTSYSVSENSLTGSGYTQDSLVCTDNNTQTAVKNPVSLNSGQNVTCVITNNDIAPTLTVVKNVINDNGGRVTAAGFTLRVNGTALTGGILSNNNLTDTYSFSGARSNTAYNVSEDTYGGYASSGWTCTDNDTHAVVANPVTLNEGQNVTCVVTNNDIAPTLALVKHVTNDNGGKAQPTDWTLSATPADKQYQTLSGAGGFASQTAEANETYTLSESGPSGYAASSWSCNGGRVTTTTVSLAPGDNVTCDITNNDIAPLLTVTKVVNNANGGTLQVSDFPLNVSGTQVTSATQNAFNAGSYLVGETQQTGYTLESISGDCAADGSITMVVGGIYSCTLTNGDVAPTLTLMKKVDKSIGGTAQPTDWTLSATPADKQYQTLSGAGGFTKDTARANEAYTLAESSGPSGYSASDWNCDNGSLDGNVLTMGLAVDVTCTITNTRDTGTVTVNKTLRPSSDTGRFNLTITGTDDFSYTASNQGNGGTTGKQTVDTGTYSVSETGNDTNLNDYYSTYECTDGEATVARGQGTSVDNLSVAKDHNIVCTFTNERLANVTVTKFNDLDIDGKYQAAPATDSLGVSEPTLPGWEMTLTNQDSLSASTQTTGNDGTTTFTHVLPGFYSLDETQQSGWNLSNIYCPETEGGLDGSFFFDISSGANIACYVGNYRNPSLSITKSNNRPTPFVLSPTNNTVTYTITVSVPKDSGAIFGATVTDLPPANFKVNNSSWTASSTNPRHNVFMDVFTHGGPSYGSPGKWYIGNLIPGEAVTLTYQAVISSTVTAGTYPDLAYVSGTSQPNGGGCPVYGNVPYADCSIQFSALLSQNSVVSASPFVGTQVSVLTPLPTTTFSAGQVLGAAVLVNTGTNLLVMQFILPVVLVAGVYLIRRVNRTPEKGGK